MLCVIIQLRVEKYFYTRLVFSRATCSLGRSVRGGWVVGYASRKEQRWNELRTNLFSVLLFVLCVFSAVCYNTTSHSLLWPHQALALGYHWGGGDNTMTKNQNKRREGTRWNRCVVAYLPCYPMLNLQGPVSVKLTASVPVLSPAVALREERRGTLLNYSNLNSIAPPRRAFGGRVRSTARSSPRRAFGGRVRSTLQGLRVR